MKFSTVLRRELRTVARTRAYVALGLGYFAVVVGVAWFTDSVGSGYLPTAASLAAPLEVVVPVVAFAMGYRVVLSDSTTGELEVLRTYGVGRAEYVAGIFVGRLIAVSVVLVAPLVVVGVLTWLYAEPHTGIVAWHGGSDSVFLLVRLAVLTLALGASVLAVSVAVSAVSGGVRSALALVVLVWLVVAVGADLAVVSGVLGGYVDGSVVVWLMSVSPTSAYRGLVMETVVGVAVGEVRATSAVVSVVSLLTWTSVSLGIAVKTVWKE